MNFWKSPVIGIRSILKQLIALKARSNWLLKLQISFALHFRATRVGFAPENLTNRQWLSVVCNLFEKRYSSSQWSNFCGLTTRSRVSPQQIIFFTTVLTPNKTIILVRDTLTQAVLYEILSTTASWPIRLPYYCQFWYF